MKIQRTISMLAVCAGLALPLPSYASGAGTTGGTILSLPVGARAIAMGEAYTAQADDANSLYWNPAGLAILNQSQASFMYNQYLEDLTLSHLAVGTPLEFGGLGASLTYLGYGKIAGYDEQANPTGNVEAHSAVATVGAGLLRENWSAGVNIKGIQGTLADEKAVGFASDFGLNVVYPREVLGGTLRAAATLRNVGTGLKYLREKDPFPREWRLGVAAVQMMDRRLNVSFDYGKVIDDDAALYAGSELWLTRYIALRAGYAGARGENKGLRAGVGLKLKDLSFDYAYSHTADFGMAHRYELTYRFGVIRPTLSPEERRLLRRGKQAMRETHYGEAVMLFDSLQNLAPKYKPVKQLLRTAMKGLQRQEAAESAADQFKFTPSMASRQAHDPSPMEAEELEQLLSLGNDMQAKSTNGGVK